MEKTMNKAHEKAIKLANMLEPLSWKVRDLCEKIEEFREDIPVTEENADKWTELEDYRDNIITASNLLYETAFHLRNLNAYDKK